MFRPAPIVLLEGWLTELGRENCCGLEPPAPSGYERERLTGRQPVTPAQPRRAPATAQLATQLLRFMRRRVGARCCFCSDLKHVIALAEL